MSNPFNLTSISISVGLWCYHWRIYVGIQLKILAISQDFATDFSRLLATFLRLQEWEPPWNIKGWNILTEIERTPYFYTSQKHPKSEVEFQFNCVNPKSLTDSVWDFQIKNILAFLRLTSHPKLWAAPPCWWSSASRNWRSVVFPLPRERLIELERDGWYCAHVLGMWMLMRHLQYMCVVCMYIMYIYYSHYWPL